MANIQFGFQDDTILLHYAVIEDNIDVAQFLLKHGIQVNSRVANRLLSLDFPTDAEHSKYIEETLGNNQINDDYKEEIVESTLNKTTTALHLAVRNENRSLAELLLHHGANVNSEMEGGETPLIVAVLSKRQNLVEYLLDNGADINAKTCWGKSSLHYASQNGSKSIVEILLKRGADINATTNNGMTALHFAVEAAHKDIISMLLKNDADINLKTKAGATVLHYAAVMNNKDILEQILNHGGDINILMKNGRLDLSAFNWITESDEKKIWELVSKYTNKMSIINWYNTMVTKLCRKSKDKKKDTLPCETEQAQEPQLQQQQPLQQ